MKRIGILGGTTPESTIYYYRLFIDISRELFERNFYPELIIFNLNLKKFEELKSWEERGKYMIDAITSLENGGAEIIGIAANTPHIVFDMVTSRTKAKMISIIDALSEEAAHRNFKKLLLLGTQTTMTSQFYKKALQNKGFLVEVPNSEEIKEINRIITEELSQGIMKSQTTLIKIVEEYRDSVDAVILGCTELPLILTGNIVDVPLLDTARIHVHKLIEAAVTPSMPQS